MSALRARLQALFGGLQRWYAGHSRRDQRILLGVLALAGFSVVYLWAWVPLRVYRQTVADEIVEGQEQLARASRALGSADSLKVERENLEKKLKQARERLLPGRGGTLGAAALQERTNSLAAEKGITVQSTQVMKEEALDPYRKVSVRLTLSGELKPFAELVSGLEYGQQLSVPIVELNRRGAVPGAKGPRTLSATIEVAGFVLSEEAKADEAPAAEPVEAAGEVATVEGADAEKATEGAGAPTGAPLPAAAPSGPPVPPPGAPSGAGVPPIPAAAPGTPTSTTVVPSGAPAVTTTTARGPAPAGAPARPRTTGTTRPTAPLPFAPKAPPTSVPVPEKGDQG